MSSSTSSILIGNITAMDTLIPAKCACSSPAANPQDKAEGIVKQDSVTQTEPLVKDSFKDSTNDFTLTQDSSLEDGFIFLEQELEAIKSELDDIDMSLNSLDSRFNTYYNLLNKRVENWKDLENITKAIGALIPVLSEERWEGILERLDTVSSAVGIVKLILPFSMFYQWLVVNGLERQLVKTVKQMATQKHASKMLQKAGSRIDDLYVRIKKKDEAAKQKIKACFLACLKYCSSWLKVCETPTFRFVTIIKSGIGAVKNFISFHEQHKNWNLLSERSWKLAPMYAGDASAAEEFNRFLSQLTLAPDTATLRKAFEERKIKAALIVDDREELQRKLADARYCLELLTSMYEGSKEFKYKLYAPQMVGDLLAVEAADHGASVKVAAAFVDSLVQKVSQLGDFEKIKGELSRHYLDLNDIDPAVTSVEAWMQKSSDPAFKKSLVEAYVQQQETLAKMLQQVLTSWISKKNKLEMRSFEIGKIEKLCYMVADIFRGVCSLPGIVDLAIVQLLLLPCVLEASFVGSFLLAWIAPALIPSLVGGVILLGVLGLAYLNKPNQYGLEGILLSLQHTMTEWFYDLYKLCNTVNQWNVLFCSFIVDGVASCLFCDVEFFKETIEALQEERKFIEAEKDGALNEINSKINVLVLKDLRLYATPGSDEQDPLDTIQKTFSFCNPQMLPKKFTDFLSRELKIDLEQDDHVKISAKVREFMVLSGEDQAKFYKTQSWLTSWKEELLAE